MDEMIKLLKNHMSVRRYKDETVSREMIDTIVQCAQMAPTSSHFQAYTIIEIQDHGKRAALSEIAGGQPWVVSSPLALLFCADLHRCKKYFENTNSQVFGNTECYTVATVDAALAAQKALIAAQCMGLGGVMVGGIRNDIGKVAEIFELPELTYPLLVLCLGYPDDEPGLKPRLPQSEIHKIDVYDESRTDSLICEYNRTVHEYYINRTSGATQDTWSERCGRLLMAKVRDDVGEYVRKAGFLQK